MIIKFNGAVVVSESNGCVELEFLGGSVLDLQYVHKSVDESDLSKAGKAGLHCEIEEIALREIVFSHIDRD